MLVSGPWTLFQADTFVSHRASEQSSQALPATISIPSWIVMDEFLLSPLEKIVMAARGAL